MLITVMLKGDSQLQQIPTLMLDELLAAGKVTAFLRSSGWAIIGRDPIRTQSRSNYDGKEMRTKKSRSCLICPDMKEGVCISTICSDRNRQAKLRRYVSVGW